MQAAQNKIVFFEWGFIFIILLFHAAKPAKQKLELLFFHKHFCTDANIELVKYLFLQMFSTKRTGCWSYVLSQQACNNQNIT